ncbi:response regulator [Woeseia oceani]|uniref:response regulator n=1 Tax=Woeseia oceani TaxID=1548547 RepID=UPI0009F34A31|nr:response regulator [Woeseia oceani]
MTLSQKLVLYLLLLGTCIGVGSYLAISYAILPAFQEFEVHESIEAVDRVESAIEAEGRTLQTLVSEYAEWDDTRDFALGRHAEYEEYNLIPNYWRRKGVDVLYILDVEGKVISALGMSEGTGVPADIHELFLGQVTPTHPLLDHPDADSSFTGAMKTADGPALVAAAPIVSSLAKGSPVGTFIVVRRLGPELLADISRRTSANVILHELTAAGAGSYSLDELKRLSSDGTSTLTRSTDQELIANRLISGMDGDPVALLEIRHPHTISKIGTETIRAAMILIGLVTAVFMVIGVFIMRYVFVRPVNEIADSMIRIRETGDLNINIKQDRADEIGQLAREFTEMTANLDHTQRELEKTRDLALGASRAKSEFLARMSHEIRTPMNGVLGMTELLRNTALDFEQRRFTETIYSSAENLLDIINDILDFSKIEAGKMDLEARDIDLGVVIEETVDSLASQAHKKGLELINDVSPDLHTSLIGDPVRIRQVLTNLISNAIKFTNRGEVVVRVSAEESAANTEAARVLIEVVDTGVGVKPEKQRDIFESFAQEDGSTTRLHGGTGLGLAISRQLVDLMGGTLQLESTPGLGSRFYFAIEMKHGRGEAVHERKATASVAGKRILVVDDNATNREILEQHLKCWRARPHCVESAREALQALQLAATEQEPFELVILDMHMPRTDGLQLARMIREFPALDAVSLMLLSSVAMPASEDTLEELKISGQLTKPIRQGHLYDALSVVLSGETVTERYSRNRSSAIRKLSGKVLLAEDNPVNQAVALGMLDSLGVDVAVVTDGQAAMDALSGQRFDLVLMDCQMPVMDGLQATREIRAAERDNNECHVPIVALTANALSGDREQCLEAGMNEYLSKPFTMDQLHAVLSIFLRTEAELADETRIEEVLSAEAASLFDTQSITIQPLDLTALATLKELQQPGSPSLIKRVIQIYLDSSGEIKERLANALSNTDTDTARESAHALKSSSINVGATRLADLCKNIETMAREHSIDGVQELRSKLEQEYGRVIKALRVELERAA